MRYLMILVAYFAFLGIGTIDAQSRYQVNNSLILKNRTRTFCLTVKTRMLFVV